MSFYDYSLPQQIIDNLYNVYNLKDSSGINHNIITGIMYAN